jgi:hypothetical protein
MAIDLSWNYLLSCVGWGTMPSCRMNPSISIHYPIFLKFAVNDTGDDNSGNGDLLTSGGDTHQIILMSGGAE